MKIRKMLTVAMTILLSVPCLAAVETAFAVATDVAVLKAVASATLEASASVGIIASQGFPLNLKGTMVQFDLNAKHEDLAAQLTKILGEKTAMEDQARLQFDFEAVAEQAPMALVVDWDEKGAISQILIDAFSEEQNPVAKELKAWLTLNAGPGVASTEDAYNKNTWEYNSWTFVFSEGGDGEDSAYGFNISPLTAKDDTIEGQGEEAKKEK